ncbi:hypothetical protein KL905_004752 [Ogataea polymorpha]|nr:hypothetical protein KL908_001685 [Ogataea polymorpha]KAG7916349.1 hypothetical protein KL905_004752 [Ogataea polymorpha]KAG7917879.1 hypothetical protein KL927_002622 [Ogataea polymorpha]
MNLIDILGEIGIWTIFYAQTNIKLIFLLKFLRAFTYGGISVILAIFLRDCGFAASSIGIFISVGTLGDLIKTSCLGLILDAYGRRRLMRHCYLMMMTTSFIFQLTTFKPLLWFTIFAGIISVGGVEVSIYRPCEHAIIAQKAQPSERSDFFTWYAFTGNLSSAMGSGVYGLLIWFLQNKFGWSELSAFKCVFFAVGLVYLLLYFLASLLDDKVELVSDHEETPKSSDSEFEIDEQKPAPTSTLQLIHSPRFGTIMQIIMLFFVDVLCKAIIIDSWVAYYIVERFGSSTKTVGDIFLVTHCVSAVMSLFGTVFCKRYGPIQTMILTHFPCSVFVFLIPFSTNMPMMVFFLLMRDVFKSMDMGSKSVFLSSVAHDNERAAALSLQNSLRLLAQVIAPIITGFMANHDLQWASFILSAVMRVVVYEGGVLLLFWRDRHKITI